MGLGPFKKGFKGFRRICSTISSVKFVFFCGLGRFRRVQKGPGGYLEAFPSMFVDIRPHGTELYNKKTGFRRQFFLSFGPWAPELLIFDLNIGFLIKNRICSPLGMSRIPKFGPTPTAVLIGVLSDKVVQRHVSAQWPPARKRIPRGFRVSNMHFRTRFFSNSVLFFTIHIKHNACFIFLVFLHVRTRILSTRASFVSILVTHLMFVHLFA